MFIDSGDKAKGVGTGRISISKLYLRQGKAGFVSGLVIKRKTLAKGPDKESPMKKTMRSDSQADAIAAVLLVVLAVAFAVVWVSGQ